MQLHVNGGAIHFLVGMLRREHFQARALLQSDLLAGVMIPIGIKYGLYLTVLNGWWGSPYIVRDNFLRVWMPILGAPLSLCYFFL